MAWIRLDDQIAHHPKLLESGPVCAWFWVCSIGFCQKFLTDGVIPTSAISTLCNVDHPNRCVEKLLAVGLFERHAKGFKIHDYLDFNESASDVKTRREQDRIRKESARTPHGQTPDSQQIPPASRARDPIPSHPKILTSNNQLISSRAAAAPTKANGKRPQFENERFAVHRWQVDELISMLGAHVEDFDLDEWLMTGCVECAKLEIAIVPDWWKWLKVETLREAQRRGLPLASPELPQGRSAYSKQSQRLLSAINNLKG